MSFPVWMLLGFAMWTLVMLLFSVGVYRWSCILTGREEIRYFRADQAQGPDWYRRAMRAHMNCVENLPVFAVIVFALHVAGITGETVNFMAGLVLIARVCQSVTHVAFRQSNMVTAVRFLFFFTQLVCFFGLAAVVVLGSLEP